MQVSSARPNPDGYKDEHCSPSEAISFDHHAADRREDAWESTQKRSVTDSKIVKNNSFVIPIHNRFSYWEEDELNEPVLSMKEEIKTDKIKLIKKNKKVHKVKVKKLVEEAKPIFDRLKVFKTKNAFGVLGELTEAEVETILEGTW